MAFEELKNRIRNMVWTVAEDFGLQVSVDGNTSFTDTKNVTITNPEILLKVGMKESEVESNALYASAHESGHVKYSTMDTLIDGMKKAARLGYDINAYKDILNVIEDMYVDYKIAVERPGFLDMRAESASSTVRLMTQKPKDITKAHIMALSCATYDLDLRAHVDWRVGIDWEKVALAKNIAMKCLNEPTSENNPIIAMNVYDVLLGKPVAMPDVSKKSKSKPDKVDDDVEENSDSDDSYNGDSDQPDEEDGDTGSGDADGEDDKGEDEDDEVEDGMDNSEDTDSDSDDEHGSDDTDVEDEDEGDTDGDEDDMDNDEDRPGDENEGDSTDDDNVDDGSADSSGDDVDDEPDLDEGFEDDVSISKEELEQMASEMIDTTLMDKFASDDAKRVVEKELYRAAVEEASLEDIQKLKDKWRQVNLENYGKPISDELDKQMEKLYCKGDHAGTNCLWTKGALRADGSNKDDIMKEKRLNLNYYNIDKSAPQQIKQLTEIIRNAMRASYDPEGYVSNNGSVMANQVWRVKCDDNNIFHKEDFNEEGGFAVQVLIDASGSQIGRVRDIAKQAYILVEALTRAGIPTMAVSFTSVQCTNIMTVYRDYDDPVSENMNVFEYTAVAENRDGLAIQIAAHNLMQRKEAHKIMIILQDGAPGDGGGSFKSAYKKLGGIDCYWGEAANKECAKVVRNVRQKGIALMGIYTSSKTEALAVEKLIFGNDFAYIKDMKDFARIAGNYIVKQIKSIAE